MSQIIYTLLHGSAFLGQNKAKAHYSETILTEPLLKLRKSMTII